MNKYVVRWGLIALFTLLLVGCPAPPHAAIPVNVTLTPPSPCKYPPSASTTEDPNPSPVHGRYPELPPTTVNVTVTGGSGGNGGNGAPVYTTPVVFPVQQDPIYHTMPVSPSPTASPTPSPSTKPTAAPSAQVDPPAGNTPSAFPSHTATPTTNPSPRASVRPTPTPSCSPSAGGISGFHGNKPFHR